MIRFNDSLITPNRILGALGAQGYLKRSSATPQPGHLVAESPVQLIRETVLTRLQLGIMIPSLVWMISGMGGVAAYALEKYGRPLPGLEPGKEEQTPNGREEEETFLGGYFLTAPFVSNPSFTARPNNTGRVAMRHMLHLETDLYKQYLTFYTDQNFFSDRDTGWIKLSEWDDTYALTGIIHHWNWRIQYERDKPLDQSGLQQIYADTLVTYRLQAEHDWTWFRKQFPNQNLTAYAGVGWLFFNHNYFARPDNTGSALYRYVAHVDLDLYRERIILYGDINMFTDRTNGHAIRPSELDWIVGLAVRWRDVELSVYREQDRPVDRSGFIQAYYAVQLRYAFDLPKGVVQKAMRKLGALGK